MKWLRRLGAVLGVLLLLIIGAAVVLYLVASNAVNQTYDVEAAPVAVPTGSDTLARGEHLARAVSLCAECHGDDLGGKDFFEDGGAIFGSGWAPNITSGEGGLPADYTVTDWVRVIRHGVGRDDKSLLFMPSHYYNHMSDADLGALIAYMQSVPPVDRDTDEISLGPMGMIVVGIMMPRPAEEIDHDVLPAAPETGVTAEYGDYLINIAACRECHAEDLDGDVPPGAPAGPDMTQNGDLGDWSQDDFVRAMREGLRPDGTVIDPDEMPWDSYTLMTDEELEAIWLYLQTLD